MKKLVVILIAIVGLQTTFAQEKKKDKAKDTIKTEVINVVTSYTPTISDAFKIKKNPTINLSKKTRKKQLNYSIFSAPVASTFIPTTGTVKSLQLGKKERLFDNYVALGFGNYTTPFAELFLHDGKNFENDMAFYLKYISSKDGVENTPLNSGYRNLVAKGFYKQEERYFTWKAGFTIKNNQYNWYGLPNITFDANSIDAIEEKQTYKLYGLDGNITFQNSYIKNVVGEISYFSDDYSSSEVAINLQPNFSFPLDGISKKLNEIDVNTSLNYLTGSFKQNYDANSEINYSFFNFGVKPVYRITSNDLSIKLGAKMYLTSDMENSVTDFLMYPDVEISHSFLSNLASIYAGVDGDLHLNSYQSLSEENPFISPTLFLTQTNEQYNFFGGLKGKFGSTVNFDLKASYKSEEDKALFVRNNSKSDGIFNAFVPLMGYEFGNSYQVLYDDVSTLSFFGELAFDVSKNMTMGFNGTLNSYTTTNQQEAWNLPKLEGSVFGKYKANRWYAATNIFYVGSRKAIAYSGTYPTATSSTQTLGSYIDVNINGGYHFSDFLSAFVKVNNLLNNDYQRFANFNVQGFQILAGVTYKFDF